MLPESARGLRGEALARSPEMFLPREAGDAVSFTNFTDLLPEFQAALNEARTPGRWAQFPVSYPVKGSRGCPCRKTGNIESKWGWRAYQPETSRRFRQTARPPTPAVEANSAIVSFPDRSRREHNVLGPKLNWFQPAALEPRIGGGVPSRSNCRARAPRCGNNRLTPRSAAQECARDFPRSICREKQCAHGGRVEAISCLMVGIRHS
jgi:hypothetical protein